MKPIPRRALIHSIILYKYLGADEYNNPQYDAGTTINAVRFEPMRGTGLSSLGEARFDKGRLFFDCFNSDPNTVVFTELDKVVFNGVDYIVRDSECFYAFAGSPHHYEVALK